MSHQWSMIPRLSGDMYKSGNDLPAYQTTVTLIAPHPARLYFTRRALLRCGLQHGMDMQERIAVLTCKRDTLYSIPAACGLGHSRSHFPVRIWGWLPQLQYQKSDLMTTYCS
jgi:hypothetical protein